MKMAQKVNIDLPTGGPVINKEMFLGQTIEVKDRQLLVDLIVLEEI